MGAMGGWRVRRAGGLAALCLLTLVACARPDGIDGDLTDDWSALPVPRSTVPAVGQCLQGTVNSWTFVEPPLSSADCSAPHTLEVVHVGRFSTATEEASAPPPHDSDETRTAYAQCDKAAREYVGGDWHDGQMFLHYSPPTGPKWQDGARSFFCSLIETGGMRGNGRSRTGSLKGALGGDRPLAKRCYNEKGTVDADGFYEPVEDSLPVDCGTAHNAEYAGTYVPPDLVYPSSAEALSRMQLDGCEQVVAGFLGLSSSALNDRAEVGWRAWGQDKYWWPVGERGITCFVLVPANLPVRGSLRQLGTRPLPR
ncbi:septum formation family protein [Planosporangium sp. 12N6]|uniref:septum formation family protein n=1 Tax=Planosporangium spinosum TaxID=3402278 RepID=UPI003CEDA6E2